MRGFSLLNGFAMAAELMYLQAGAAEVVKVRVSKEHQARVDRLTAEHRCLGCERKLATKEVDVGGVVVTRIIEKVSCGQCTTCYSGSLRSIARGTHTRKELIGDGFMLPPGHAGRRATNKFTARLSEHGSD